MSLFSNDEVCETCRKAIFHDCCKTFCRCIDDHDINGISGDCDFKVEWGSGPIQTDIKGE
jgi:hypothetical protein